MRDEERGKRLIAVFLLGAVLFNFPLIAVIDAARSLTALPPLVLYLFAVWAILILFLILLTEGRANRHDHRDRP